MTRAVGSMATCSQNYYQAPIGKSPRPGPPPPENGQPRAASAAGQQGDQEKGREQPGACVRGDPGSIGAAGSGARWIHLARVGVRRFGAGRGRPRVAGIAFARVRLRAARRRVFRPGGRIGLGVYHRLGVRHAVGSRVRARFGLGVRPRRRRRWDRDRPDRIFRSVRRTSRVACRRAGRRTTPDSLGCSRRMQSR